MAKSLALLDYCFLFDPSQTWAHVSEFEKDLRIFFRDHNMECEALDNINPKDGRRIVYISVNKQVQQMGASNAQTAQKLNSRRSK